MSPPGNLSSCIVLVAAGMVRGSPTEIERSLVLTTSLLLDLQCAQLLTFQAAKLSLRTAFTSQAHLWRPGGLCWTWVLPFSTTYVLSFLPLPQIMKAFEARCLELTEGGNQALDEEAARQRLQELEVTYGCYGLVPYIVKWSALP